MNKTTNLKLNKPTMTDFVSESVEDVFGENFDIIDNEFTKVRNENNSHKNNVSNPHKVTFAQTMTSLSNDADLDTLFDVGVFNVPDNTTNAPVATGGVMIGVHPRLYDNIYQNAQIYIPLMYENMVYRRVYFSDGWSEWKVIGCDSPEFTGTPKAPTAPKGTNTTQIATTAFVAAAIAAIQITKEAVGLGNVPNVTTNDQTPTYSAASSLATLSSGEKLSVSMGKIMLAITNLINHIANKSNPHSVTASQVGLGNVTNESKSTMFASPTFTGTPKVASSTAYSTAKLRNIVLWTSGATAPTSSNGDIVIKTF